MTMLWTFSRVPYTAVLLFSGALLLAGCEREEDGPPTVADTDKQVLSGKVMYRERMAMPAGASVTVTLADVSRADAPARTIAEQHIDNPGQVPVPFELHYLPAAITLDAPMAYAIRAQIRGADEQLLWTSTQRHSVRPGAEDAQADVTVMVERVSPVQQHPMSPAMQNAQSEGASFWASGNEPGWHLAIYPGKELVFTGDYGNSRVVVPDSGALMEGDKTLYQGRSEEKSLQVEINASPCQDSMSGKPFDYTVTVILDEKRFIGCGLDL